MVITRNLTDFDKDELIRLFGELGEPKFRASQAFKWVHQKNAASVSGMTDMPKALRERLAERAALFCARIVKKEASADNSTIKYLLKLENGAILNSDTEPVLVEGVFMRRDYGAAACVSTQAGCRMGCAFCATAAGGLKRNLTAGEMAGQVYAFARDTGERISRVVLMGMGEPLDNYENVLRFIRLISDKDGAGISERRITVSTCGLTDNIARLAGEGLRVTFAVSLHAPNDVIRRRLMPIAGRFPIGPLIEASADYANKTKRRVTYEYALIKGVNDAPGCARELAARLRGTLAHVNLISINPGRGGFLPPKPAAVNAFAEIIRSSGVETTIRRSLGSDINAACGQLTGNRAVNGGPNAP
jgi:23S rRNA (adenine2503-C2)-methyltransferase